MVEKIFYRHYKGHWARVIGTSFNRDTGIVQVQYQTIQSIEERKADWFERPLKEWEEMVTIARWEGDFLLPRNLPRYEPIRDPDVLLIVQKEYDQLYKGSCGCVALLVQHLYRSYEQAATHLGFNYEPELEQSFATQIEMIFAVNPLQPLMRYEGYLAHEGFEPENPSNLAGRWRKKVSP